MFKVAVSERVVTGANCTLMVQVAPAASELPHGVAPGDSIKSVELVLMDNVTGVLWLLVTVTVLGAD